MSKTTALHVHHASQYISLTSTARLRRENPECDVLWRTWIYFDKFSFLYLNMEKAFKNSTPCRKSRLHLTNRPFYRYGGHIEFIRFKEYYGMPRGHSLSIYTGFLGKMRTSMTIFISKKAIIITSKKGTMIFFSHYNLFLGKLKEKLVRKARINTDASTSDRAHAPWASHNTP